MAYLSPFGEATTLDVPLLRSLIDHAILDPELTWSEIEVDLRSAEELGVFAVFVPTVWTRNAVAALDGSATVVGAPIGFPHGTASTAAKLAEVRQAIDDGAAEIDVVQQIGWARSGRYSDVSDEIAQVVDAADGRVVKAILETAYLDDEQVARSTRAASDAGVHFVKTSTGFARAGATLHNVEIMMANAGQATAIKASSGVRTLDTVLTLLGAGVTRFGMSNTRAVLADLHERIEGGTVFELSEILAPRSST